MNRGDRATIAKPGDFGQLRLALVIQSDRFSRHANLAVLLVSGMSADAPVLFVKVSLRIQLCSSGAKVPVPPAIGLGADSHWKSPVVSCTCGIKK